MSRGTSQDGKEVAKIEGSNIPALKAAVNEHAPKVEA